MKAKSSYIVRLIISIWVLWLVIAAPGWAATYYVDVVNGSDGNLGTSADDAWKTLHYAVSKLQTGDVLNVAAGTYRLIDAATNPEGEADAPLAITQDNITIQGAAGAVLDGESNCSLWDSAFEIDASNVTIKNLKITNFTCDAVGENILIVGGSNNRIESCDISNSGIGIRFSYSSTGSNNVVENCSIYKHISRGIEIVRDSPRILRNQIYENGTNIYIIEDSGQTIQPVIANNLIYAMSSPPGRGIEIYAYSTGSTVAGQIFHNTLVNAGQSLSRGVYVDEESPGEKVKIQYNIITGFEIGILDGFPGAGALEFNYNNVINNATDYSGVAVGNNDISMDPLFVDAVGLDFHLETTSPLLNLIRSDAGDTVVDDLEGLTRPNGLGREMGCFEIDTAQVLWVHNVASGTGYNWLVMPDIDGDEHDELLLFEDYEQIRVISGADGTTELWAYVMSAEPLRYRRGLAIVDDLDGDNVQDIIAVAGTSGNDYGQNNDDDDVYAISGAIAPPGGRVLWGGNPVHLGYGASSPVILKDINNDSYPDIFLNTISPDIPPSGGDLGFLISGIDGAVLWNYTYNPFTPASPDSGIWDVHGKTASPDLDGDGKDDIVVSGAGGLGGIEAWKGGSAMAANIWRSLPNEWIRDPCIVGDLTGDGVPEVAAAKFNDADLKLYVLNGANGIEVWNHPFGNTATTMQNIGDINGSGYDDIVMGSAFINGVGGTDYKVYALEGNPGAGTRVIWSYDVGENSYVKVVSDADGDGEKDVAVAGQMDSLLLLSGADGSVLAQESFPNGSGTVQPGEFNNAAGDDMLTSMGSGIYALSFTEILGNDRPARPTLISPADEAVFGDSTSIKLKSSAFSDPEDDAQAGSTWTLVRADSEEPAGSFPVTFTQEPFPTEYYIPDQLLEGLKYTWQVGHKDDQGREVWSEKRSFKIGTSVPESLPSIASGSTLVDFGMISVVHWPDNPVPGKVFNIEYNPRVYRIGTYDPVLGRYIEFGPDLVIEPGRAYWMLARDGLTVNFDGVPVSKETYIEVCLHHNGSTDAPNGWNMIAPPNTANYLWNEVLVGRRLGDNHPDNVSPVPVTYPAASELINHRIYEWQGGKYKDHRLDEDFVLEYYKGYWVKALVEGAYLEFPVSAQVNGLSTPRNTMLAWKGKAVQWMKSLLPAPSEAIADDDLPPMPMGGFEDSVDPVFEGCFVQTLK
ncbi:MAG: hypothetical protein ABFS43_12590 [Thermodesulfobacteriota bacterium]